MSRGFSGGPSLPRGQDRGGGPRGGHQGGGGGTPTFDPARPLADLVDSLAEDQARQIPKRGSDELTSNQLRRFFGDVKDLYRQLEQGSDYAASIEPRFKMMRSKASYALRKGQSRPIPLEFYSFINNGVSKVKSEEDFRKFVQHFEAVVGFLYGTGKVGK